MWLIEAYIAIKSQGHVFPFGIYEDNKAVCFLMIEFGTDDDWKDALEKYLRSKIDESHRIA